MLQKLIDQWAELVIRYRILVLISALFFVVAMMMPMKNIYFDTSNEIWFLPNDPSIGDYGFLKETFGSPQSLLISIPARADEDQVITKENLITIHEITSFLEDHQYVDKVSSLSKYQVIQAKNDTLTTIDLVEDFDEFTGSTAEIQRIRNIMKKEELVHDFLITRDFQHTLISARFEAFSETPEEVRLENEKKVVLVDDLRAFLKEKGYAERGYQFYFMGEPYISQQFIEASMADQVTTFPLMFILITAFLILSFRSIPGVVGPWIIIIASALSMMGLIGVMGWPMNMLNAMLPILLVVVGVGDSVHIIVEFYHSGNRGLSSKESAAQAIKKMFMPCFYTTLTTFIGFMAISVTRLVPIKQYGITAGAGVVFALLFSVSVLPAFLSFVSAQGKRAESLAKHGWVAKFTAGLTPWCLKNRALISILFVVVSIGSLALSTKIEVNSNFIKSFRAGTPIRESVTYFEESYNGGVSLEFVFDTKEEGGVKNPEFLQRVLHFQDYAENLENTGRATSMINFVRKMNQTMHNEDPAYYRIPESNELVAQYLFLYAATGPEEDLSDLKSFDERYLRVSLQIPNMTTTEMDNLIGHLKTKLQTDYASLNGVVTGDMVLWTKMGQYIQEGLVSSFSIALVAILLCFFVLFRSFKYGLLALIPSASPILIAGGVMAWLEVYLDFGTMIIAAITFGIAVDDTIHVMTRFIEARKKGESHEDAIAHALTGSGRAVVFTSIILSCGFSILLLSNFMMNVYFGLFGTIIILIALVADLVVLPAIVFLFQGKNNSTLAQATAAFMAMTLVGLSTSPQLAQAEALSALQIMQNVDDRDTGESSISYSTMILIDRKERQRIRQTQTFSKEYGEDTKSITFFLSPADIKNTGFLSYEWDDTSKEDDSWLYLPALKSVKRIAASDRSGSFMGSDFSYSDMEGIEIEDYDYSLVPNTEKEMVDGHAVWVIEAKPKKSRKKEVIEETGYVKSHMWVRKDIFMVVKAKHWVKKGKKLKFFTASDITKVDDIWTAKKLQMVTTKKGKRLHATILQMDKIQYNQGVSDNTFSIQSLERGL